MSFDKRLREGVRRGDITCSVRIWTRPHVKAGGRYGMEDGEIEIESIRPIDLSDVTPEIVRECGFPDLQSMLQIARHGKGENVYLIRFHYLPPRAARSVRNQSASAR